ncbi:MAG: hypothetical protein HZB62_08890 [Nitrospirae bacterium]|nr:hypothetical protein [Nitrospirota bacterium]
MIGFDARRMNLRPKERWIYLRKEEYLIDRNVKQVLSTDDMVWPSLFEQMLPQQFLDMGLEKLREMYPTMDFPQPGPFTPEWIGQNAPFWENLNDLRQHVALANPTEEIWIIAGSMFVDDETKANSRPDWPPYINMTEPADRDPSWPLLGYDVSDEFHLSGLSNCGYKETDFAEYSRQYWSDKINENHLFSDLKTAFEFTVFSNNRVPEHAPFFVYGLYRIEILNAELGKGR